MTVSELGSPRSQSTITFDSLPEDVLMRIVYWVSNGTIQDGSNSVIKHQQFPSHVYILNSKRCGISYKDLLALSSTSTRLRILLGPYLFYSVSLVRRNQIDSILCTPRLQELFSDRKLYQREFLSELVQKNLESCRDSELARNSFRSSPRGDKFFRSRYELELCMCNFVQYVECDNTILKTGELRLFPIMQDLKVLDQRLDVLSLPLASPASPASPASLVLQAEMENMLLNRLTYLAVHAQTLVTSKLLSDTLPVLQRLDLFLDFDDLSFPQSIDELISNFLKSLLNLKEFTLVLHNPFAVNYLGTINLLSVITGNAKLRKLTIRLKRRKSHATFHQSRWPLYSGYAGDQLLKLFSNLESLIVDIRIIDQMKFSPFIYNTLRREPEMGSETETETETETEIQTKVDSKLGAGYKLFTNTQTNDLISNNASPMVKHLILVDQAIVGPHISSDRRELLDVIIRHGRFTTLSFQYGEALEESHLHILKMVTDFVSFICNNVFTGYRLIDTISVQKCWSVTDDSIIREYLRRGIEDKDKNKLSIATMWGKTAFNSPRFRKKELFKVTYSRMDVTSIADPSGYFLGVSTQPSYKANYTMSPENNEFLDDFWSIEASLTDFEQYVVHQRQSLLFG